VSLAFTICSRMVEIHERLAKAQLAKNADNAG